AASGAVCAHVLLRRAPLPTGIVVAHAVTAAGLLSALRAAEIPVPGDLSVVALHDSWFLAHLSVPLTTVRLPLQALDGAAARVLIEEVERDDRKGTSAKESGTINETTCTNTARDELIREPLPQLIERESTGEPRM